MSNEIRSIVPPSQDVRNEALDRALELSKGLYPHQVEGLAFLLSRRRAILADDMGLGKTRQAIVAMRAAEPAGPYLVICPAAVKLNWKREIKMVDDSTPVSVLPKDDFNKDGLNGWVVLNYDILSRQFDRLASIQWAGIVYDEAHYLKNRKSRRSVLARKLVQDLSSDPVVYCLTGTPLTNRPRDLFPLLEIVRHPIARSFLTYAKRYCDAEKGDFGWVTDGASNLDELALQLSGVMIRRKKSDVLDLPPKTRQWLRVECKEKVGVTETKKVLEALLGTGSAKTESKRQQSLLQALSSLRRKLAIAKIPHTIEHVTNILDQGDKVLVFSGFTKPLELIKEEFGEACLVIQGSTNPSQRQHIVDEFQSNPEIKVIAANIIAGGVGLNITAARQVVFNDLDWVPANHWQAEDRAHRIGQDKSVMVSYLVANGTMDAFVEEVLHAKSSLFDAVVDGKALEDGVGRDVLAELEHRLQELSSGFADQLPDKSDPDFVKTILGRLKSTGGQDDQSSTAADKSVRSVLPDEVLDILADVLRGPKSSTYTVKSNSDKTKCYQLDVIGGEVICTCPGFEYRGTCSHERKLREGIEKGVVSKQYELTQ